MNDRPWWCAALLSLGVTTTSGCASDSELRMNGEFDASTTGGTDGGPISGASSTGGTGTGASSSGGSSAGGSLTGASSTGASSSAENATGGTPSTGATGSSSGGTEPGAGGSVDDSNGKGDGDATGGSSSDGDATGGGGNGDGDGGSGGGGSGNGDGGSGGNDSGTGGGENPSGTGGGAPVAGSSSVKSVAAKLGRDHFLIGMGNDLASDHNEDGAYTLGVTLDLHYAYLVGLQGQGGWPDWNPGGYFVNILADTAKSKGVVPMFTLYSMAAWGEANAATVTNSDYMAAYWAGAMTLFQRLGEFDNPSVVHFEPDWWAFAQQQSSAPTAMAVQVTQHAPDCAGLPNNMVGMGKCLVLLARKYSPKTIIGFHASRWAGSPQSIVNYLLQIGAGDADIMVLETLDRDAGCFEAQAEGCTRNDGPWYWDETNQTSPNFHEHLSWAKTIGDGMNLPLLWWQMPFGVPSGSPGGSSGHYRDNRVKYLFEHVDEFVAAGGVGAVFGVGAAGQTYITTDGGQFRNAVTNYFANPYEL